MNSTLHFQAQSAVVFGGAQHAAPQLEVTYK